MYGLYQLALLDICMINIGSVIGIGRFWQKYNRYRYNQKLPYRYTSNCVLHVHVPFDITMAFVKMN